MLFITAKIKIDDDGQINLPIELNKELDLENNDWFKVRIKSDCIELIPNNDEVDEEFLDVLIHEGILIDVERT